MLIGAGVAVVGAVAGFAGYQAIAPPKRPEPSPTSSGDELAKLSDVPENGGIVLSAREIVLCRGTGTDVRAFSAVCTHQKCLVAEVTASTINCNCHGSQFSTTTGEPVAGPAEQFNTGSLDEIAVTVTGDMIRKG